MFFRIFLLSSFIFIKANAFCWQPGWNPSFKGPPYIQQLNKTTIWISWMGLVIKPECVDQFFVKYWPTQTPNPPMMTPATKCTNTTIYNFPPRVPHNFQIIAREDKGIILGVKEYRSPVVTFSTIVENSQPPAAVLGEPRNNVNQISTNSGRESRNFKLPEGAAKIEHGNVENKDIKLIKAVLPLKNENHWTPIQSNVRPFVAPEETVARIPSIQNDDDKFPEKSPEESPEESPDESPEESFEPETSTEGSGDTFLYLGIGLGCLVGVICIGGVAFKFGRKFGDGKGRRHRVSKNDGDNVDSDFESY